MRGCICSGLLLSSATAVLLAAVAPAAAADIDDMRAQIQALQDKIAKIEAQEQRHVAPAAAVEADSKPKSWKLPGTNTSMNIGGFAILQFDYDLNGVSSYGPANAQVTGTAGAKRQNQFNMDARQSRFFISTSTPTDWGDLLTHIEIDANGNGGTSGVEAQYSSGQGASMRLRKAYGRWVRCSPVRKRRRSWLRARVSAPISSMASSAQRSTGSASCAILRGSAAAPKSKSRLKTRSALATPRRSAQASRSHGQRRAGGPREPSRHADPSDACLRQPAEP